ncbi:DUF2946 domain-containing protein [Glaciimonas soli]|nr:DUF2946 domain-containing protein [Glaciimonas soli]
MKNVIWIATFAILMNVFAPLISHTLAQKNNENAHQAALMTMIADATFCTTHDASQRAQQSHADHDPNLSSNYSSNHDADHSTDHDGMEACGYCSLLAHQPFLTTAFAQLDAATTINGSYVAALSAAFQPYTVAHANRAQPPPAIA